MRSQPSCEESISSNNLFYYEFAVPSPTSLSSKVHPDIVPRMCQFSMEMASPCAHTIFSPTSFRLRRTQLFVVHQKPRRHKIRILLPKTEPSPTMTANTQTACDTAAAWSLESSTAAQRALNPVAEETAPLSPQLDHQFPVEQVLTRTIILEQRSPKKASPKRTSKMDSAGGALNVTAPPTVASGVGSTTSKRAKRPKPTPCPSASCRLSKKILSSRVDDKEDLDSSPVNYVKGDLQEERAHFDRCVGIDTKPRTRDFKRTIFSKIAEESFKVRRVQRKKAKPAPIKGKVKTTKAAQLRFKFIRNQDVSSSLTEAHMKKYHKPPFKTVGVLRLCYEKLSEKLEKLKIHRGRSKSPAKKKTKTKRK